jgi:negative regulator of sigma E activity
MTDLDDHICEQLSAWMDGALPAAEARFLERRLQHDAA